jgi:NAD(P)-dependent dehydrogenase (short-subunit alcohol dehydrogenase family)
MELGLSDKKTIVTGGRRAAEALGGIDILVNNAGGGPSRGDFETLSDEDWQAGLDGKLFSMIRCSRSEEEFFHQTAEKKVPLGRFGRPDEVASIVVFLAGERASYATGASADVAGGMGKYV